MGFWDFLSREKKEEREAELQEPVDIPEVEVIYGPSGEEVSRVAKSPGGLEEEMPAPSARYTERAEIEQEKIRRAKEEREALKQLAEKRKWEEDATKEEEERLLKRAKFERKLEIERSPEAALTEERFRGRRAVRRAAPFAAVAGMAGLGYGLAGKMSERIVTRQRDRGSLRPRAGVVSPSVPASMFDISAMRQPGMDLSALRHPGSPLATLQHPAMATRGMSPLPAMRTSTAVMTKPMLMPGAITSPGLDTAPPGVHLATGEQVIDQVDYPVLFHVGPKTAPELGKAGSVVITKMQTGFLRFRGIGEKSGRERSKMIGRSNPEDVAMKHKRA